MVESLEPIEYIQVYETNQATDAHLRFKDIGDVEPYDCVVIKGVVDSRPVRTEGGHVFTRIRDDTGVIDCAAYSPTGGFRDIVASLEVGDEVVAYGGVSRYVNTVNLEKLRVLRVVEKTVELKPVCCGRTMTSAGRGKGFKCRVCGGRKADSEVSLNSVEKTLKPGFYSVPPRARRHLSKPLFRL